jgi:hypothetical protein
MPAPNANMESERPVSAWKAAFAKPRFALSRKASTYMSRRNGSNRSDIFLIVF